jgi:putative addiction module component (TIGR02574 family)
MYNQAIVSAATKKVLAAALKLDPEARAAVAHELLDSLDDTGGPPLSPAWEGEIDRRIQALQEGRLETISSEQVHAELDERRRARRSAK